MAQRLVSRACGTDQIRPGYQDLGPERTFPIPAGILNPHGVNTIAIAVWGEQGTAGGIGSSGGLGNVTLFEYGNFSGGVPIQIVPAPQAQ